MQTPPHGTAPIHYGDDFTDLDWAQHLYLAYKVAKDSPDPSTQNGAMLYNPEGTLIGCDFNRFPNGVEYYPERWERPLKYKIIEHAERNSIYWAASLGRRTLGSTMVAPWAACSDCARAIIQSGVQRLVRHQEASDRSARSPGNWVEDIQVADQMLKEGEVEIINVSWDFSTSDLGQIRHSGEPWTPGEQS